MLRALPIHPSLSPTPDLFTKKKKSFAFSRMSYIVGIMQYVAFSDWLLSLSNPYLVFLHFFLWLNHLFLLALKSTPLSGCTTVYPVTH